jgi:hypothetical protein
MPPLARWYVKCAIVYFLTALLLGILQAAHRPLGLSPIAAAAGPAQLHLLVVGWITSMIFGVAYWMFPKYSAAAPRGIDAVAIATFICLNVGLVLRVAVEPVLALRPAAGGLLGWLLVCSAVLQWMAGIGFVVNTWPRIKGP